MDNIVIKIPQKLIDYCNSIGVKEKSKIEELFMLFVEDTLDVQIPDKFVDKFKKWELQRYGIM